VPLPADPAGLATTALVSDRAPAQWSPGMTDAQAQRLFQDMGAHQQALKLQIEELQRTQAALRQSHARYLDLYQRAPVGYCTVNAQGLIIEFNQMAATLLQVAGDDLLQHAFVLNLVADQRAGFADCCQRLRQTGQTQTCSVQMLRRDANAFWASLSVNQAPGLAGAATLRVAFEDISGSIRECCQGEAARAAMHQELQQSHQRLRDMAAQNEQRLEQERKSIAREVHDELGQVLTALRLNLSAVKLRFATQDEALLAQVTGMKALVDRALDGVRHVAGHLRPAELALGLPAALAGLCDVVARRAGMACQFSLHGAMPALEEARAIVIYRIVQESLTNISRHARARHASVTLSCHDHRLALTVCDDGCGFDPQLPAGQRSFGLLGMCERAAVLGSTLHIRSAPGHGCQIELLIPVSSTPTNPTGAHHD